MSVYQIPLYPGAQQFLVTLDNKTLQIRLIWREAEGGGWFIDFLDVNEIPILCGIPLRCGHNLLGQYEYLGLGKMQAMINNDDRRDPTYEDMGNNLELYWTTWQTNTNDTAN